MVDSDQNSRCQLTDIQTSTYCCDLLSGPLTNNCWMLLNCPSLKRIDFGHLKPLWQSELYLAKISNQFNLPKKWFDKINFYLGKKHGLFSLYQIDGCSTSDQLAKLQGLELDSRSFLVLLGIKLLCWEFLVPYFPQHLLKNPSFPQDAFNKISFVPQFCWVLHPKWSLRSVLKSRRPNTRPQVVL